jgi:succinoglycan biosynthesis protein ExoV
VKLFYYQDLVGNFGDDLNAWLWPRLIPELLDEDDSTLFVGIGSILDRRIPQEPRKVVFGAGVGYGLLPVLDERWQICCVRGPLTARALGLPSAVAVTDSAALVSMVRAAPFASRQGVSFIPHFRTSTGVETLGIDLEQICARLGINYIDPCGPVEDVLRGIESSTTIVAEAMHGAIVADTLRVPWVPVQLSGRILNLKWLDWCGSLQMEYKPLRHLPGIGDDLEAGITSLLRYAATSAPPMLSKAQVLDNAIRSLSERLEALEDGRYEDCVVGSAAFEPNPEVLSEVPWLFDMQIALKELSEVIPLGATFILVDEQQWGGGQVLAGRCTLPFLERDGLYWGLPPDSHTAINELERLRADGAQYIAFMRPSFWWLDYYSALHDHLRRYRIVAESNRIVVFAL